MLDEKGIAASTGSACTTKEKKPSHVLLAIGCSAKKANESLRFTLSKDTTKEELDYTIKVLKEILKK